jgi:hypothetical protein
MSNRTVRQIAAQVDREAQRRFFRPERTKLVGQLMFCALVVAIVGWGLYVAADGISSGRVW